MKINLNKVICVDLMKWNDQLINEFADYFGLNGEALCNNKKDGVKKYYISTEIEDLNTGFYGGHNVVAMEFTDKPKVNTGGHVTKHNLKLNVPFTTREIKKLREIEPFDFVKFRKRKNIEASEKRKLKKLEEQKSIEVNLDIDSILDKISKYGINSLSKQEKDFLDGL